MVETAYGQAYIPYQAYLGSVAALSNTRPRVWNFACSTEVDYTTLSLTWTAPYTLQGHQHH